MQNEKVKPVSGLDAFRSVLRSRASLSVLRINALLSFLQSVVSIVGLFLAYQVLISHAGIERAGVWSLLLACASLLRVGDVSGASAMGRFVAGALSRQGSVPASVYVHTVVLTALAINLSFCLLMYLLAPYAGPQLLAGDHLKEAMALLPLLLVVTLLGPIAMTIMSGIDGAQRADERAIVGIVSTMLFVASALLLIPRHGVSGFAEAQALQYGVQIVLGWTVLRQHVPHLGWFPYRWRTQAMRATLPYSLKISVTGVVAMLFEPAAKFGFNSVGGPGLVAYYELASRVIVQSRSLVIAAATPLTPAFAALLGPSDPAFWPLLRKSTRTAALAAVAVCIVALAGLPCMSWFVLGRLDATVLGMGIALTLGWSMQLPAVGFYLAAQGQGALGWNFLSHLLIGVCVLAGALVAAPAYGWPGLIAAIVLGLLASVAPILAGNAHAFGVMHQLGGLARPVMLSSGCVLAACGGAASLVAWGAR